MEKEFKNAETIEQKTSLLNKLKDKSRRLQKELDVINSYISRLDLAIGIQVENEKRRRHPSILFHWRDNEYKLFRYGEEPEDEDEEIEIDEIPIIKTVRDSLSSKVSKNLIDVTLKFLPETAIKNTVKQLSELKDTLRPALNFYWGEFNAKETYIPELIFEKDADFDIKWKTEEEYPKKFREAGLGDFTDLKGYFGKTICLTPRVAKEMSGKVVAILSRQRWYNNIGEKEAIEFILLHGYDKRRHGEGYSLNATDLKLAFGVYRDNKFINHWKHAYTYNLDQCFGTGSGMDSILIISEPNPSLKEFINGKIAGYTALYVIPDK